VSTIRFGGDGFLKLVDGLVDLAFLGERVAEVVVGLGVIRLQADGLPVLAERLVQLAFPAAGVAEVVVGVGVIGFQADGFGVAIASQSVGVALPGFALAVPSGSPPEISKTAG